MRDTESERATAVYRGRFNPPYREHLGVIQRFRDRYDLIVAIGSAERRNERTNPFSGSERKAMMEAYLGEAGIAGVRVVALEDGDSETWAVNNLIRACKPDGVLLSTDRRDVEEDAHGRGSASPGKGAADGGTLTPPRATQRRPLGAPSP